MDQTLRKMQIKEPADPAAVDEGTVVNYLDLKGIRRFADVLVAQAGNGWQPFVNLDGPSLKG